MESQQILNWIGGSFALIFFFCALALVFAWVVFPFIVIGRLARLEREAKKQTELLEQIAKQTRPPGAKSDVRPSHKYEMPP